MFNEKNAFEFLKIAAVSTITIILVVFTIFTFDYDHKRTEVTSAVAVQDTEIIKDSDGNTYTTYLKIKDSDNREYGVMTHEPKVLKEGEEIEVYYDPRDPYNFSEYNVDYNWVFVMVLALISATVTFFVVKFSLKNIRENMV